MDRSVVLAALHWGRSGGWAAAWGVCWLAAPPRLLPGASHILL